MIQYVIRRFKENRIKNKIRKCRSRKLTKHNKRFIIRKFVKNHCFSVAKVSAEFNEKFSSSISPETVRRVLREVGLYGHSARKKFFVSAKNRKFRLSFAKSMINKPEMYVLFADERKFNIFGSDVRIIAWREEKMKNLFLTT